MSRAKKLSQRSSRAMKEDWLAWAAWCRRHRFKVMPASPQFIASWIRELFEKDEKSLATIRRRLWAIGRWHLENDHLDPTKARVVANTLDRIARDAPPQRKAEILSDDDVQAMLQTQAATTIGRRNRALLLMAVAVRLNRCDLVAIDRNQLDIAGPAPAAVSTRGRWIQLPTPVLEALQEWDAALRADGINSGALFRAVDRHGNVGCRLGAGEVNRIFKSMARHAALDKAEITSRSVFRPREEKGSGQRLVLEHSQASRIGGSTLLLSAETGLSGALRRSKSFANDAFS